MNIRTIATTGLTCALFSGLPAGADEVRFDLANEYSPTSLVASMDQDFIDTVAEKSGDTIVITPHFGGSLGFKSKDHFDLVGDGVLPIAGTYTGAFVGIDRMFALSSMPFLAPDVDGAKRLYEIAKPYYEEIFEQNGQKLLYASPYTPVGIWAGKALSSKEDLKDLKIRTYDAASNEVFQVIGAAPIQTSWSDVVPLLGTGGIDAVLTSDESGVTSNFWDYLSHFNALPYSIAINMTHMNADSFDALSPEQQAAIEEAAALVQERNWKRVEERVARNLDIMAEHGIAVVAPDPELVKDLSLASETVLTNWLADTGDDGKAIVSAFRGGS
ncbi:TRAP transporter substrate-binding protein [Ponticoccus alexandrii]|uniref:C4-dicarboxylate ABC transporter substrate-binding protein n=1 Tax=Ponticoccus alexandrii TaxID=1943633 RepID=A0ABX7FH14_9RHOB|nr:TRAP transporter substrate-binding protein [Ponticoccus alexandrii]ETA49449.1 hypothetical protein P279_24665 [Rhodobacteraceae bacterium PD-2]QRF69356.1 C4-dicarboxylate ABC transporter substrate-binding protein [Ponticoccus alexandrii]